MTQSALLDRISADALNRYGNFDEPHFFFVQPAVDNSPLRRATLKLQDERTRVIEDTDPNYDVSLAFRIENDRERLFLQESLIGPYAALRRLRDDGSLEIIETSQGVRTSLEDRVLNLLSELNLTLVDRGTLLTPFQIRLFNTEITETTIYHALFSDSDLGA